MEAQHERLLRAMTEVAARRGYAGASVERVCEHAGVARASFYQRFANREACFEAAYEEAVAALAERLGPLAGEEFSCVGLERALEGLLAVLAADLTRARLLLVEAHAAGPCVRERHDELIAALESSLAAVLDAPAEVAAAPQIPAAALLGGIAGTVSMRVFAGQGAALPAIAPELAAWVRAYALPGGEPPLVQRCWGELGSPFTALAAPASSGAQVALLPRGAGALGEAEAARRRRERILAALTKVAAARGYEAVSVADIVAAARVTRGSFYSCFRGKQSAFLAAQTRALQESVAATAAEFFLPDCWPERVWRAGAAMLGYVARNPDLARIAILETCAAGELAVRRQHDTCAAFTVFLEEGYRLAGPTAPPRIASDAIAWAVFALMRNEVLADRTSGMLSILPAAAYVILAPFLGPRHALDFVAARSRRAGPAAPTPR